MVEPDAGPRRRIAIALAVVAGVAYCSWPLGYVLNPLVSRRGLASELAALHQPYNWLFILLDVLAGTLIVAVARLLRGHAHRRMDAFALVNYALFGLLTAIDAALPMTCEPSLTTCPSLSHQPVLILHGIASIGASVCLFLSAVVVWGQKRGKNGGAIVTTFMVGWLVFGVLSLYFLVRPGPGYLVQRYYITLCSAWIMALPSMLVPRG